MNIKPWGDWIAVIDPPADAQTDKTRGGVVLPPGVGVDVLNRGVVVGLGPDIGVPDGFGEGAVIWFPHNCAREIGKGELKFVQDHCVVAWEPVLDNEGA